MEKTFYVTLSASDAAEFVKRGVVETSATGEVIDDYVVPAGGAQVRVIVFEKYFYRVSNRLTLTVVIDDASGRTRVHSVSGGGGQGVFLRFDWGAAESFASAAYDALSGYLA